jgi:hypothetical protein
MSGGGSILLAILFSGILYTIGASFVGFRAACDLHMLRITIREKLMDNAESGIHWLMTNTDIPVNETPIDLFGEETDSVLLTRKSWGVYEVLSATAFHHRDTFRLTALTGVRPKNPEMALYLPNTIHALTLSGKSLITGDVWIPEKGVQRGNTDDQPFQGERLVAGKINTSENALPEIPARLVEEVRKLITHPSNGAEPDALSDTGALRFFEKPTLCIGIQNESLAGLTFNGNVMLYSGNPVRIPAECQLQDVLVIAPSITVERGFKGSCQLFAEDSIVIESDTELLFPSAAIIVSGSGDEPNRIAERIVLKENAFLGGAIMMLSNRYVHRRRPFIHIQKGATVNGFMYSAYDCSIEGNCFGTIMAQRLRHRSSGGNYTNHLVNAQINALKFSRQMVFPFLINPGGRKSIIKYAS